MGGGEGWGAEEREKTKGENSNGGRGTFGIVGERRDENGVTIKKSDKEN